MADNRYGGEGISTASATDYLAELIRNVGSVKENEDTTKEKSTDNKPQEPDMLSSLLSNPEILAKLPSIIASVKPIIEILGAGAFGGAASNPMSALNPSAGSRQDRGSEKNEQANKDVSVKKGGDRRSELLCALKPYLCEDRQRAIDYVIKLDRLGDVLKSL